jgi:ABC-type amino acid transport substrate-binding protein
MSTNLELVSRALRDRRAFLKTGASVAMGAGAFAFAACQTSSPGTVGNAASGESVLDKWVNTKKATLGVDLTFKPLQFKDPATGKPTGYVLEITQLMMSDLGVTPAYVEIPFGQLFAALQAGKFDMMGVAATILPTRALRGLFAGMPQYYETNFMLLKPGSKLTDLNQLNDPGVTITAVQGSSEEFTGKLLFPRAKPVSFTTTGDCLDALGTGRADGYITNDFGIPDALGKYPNIKILPGGAVFVNADTYFMPLNDYKLWYWVTNWMRYQATHETFRGLWGKWGGDELHSKYGISTYSVGGAGEAVRYP